MSKYTPIKLTQLSANESAAVDAINQNLDSIKEHIDDSLSRSAKSPSQMLADLDMNGQKLLNLGAPTKDTDVVRLKDVIENKEEIKTLVNTASVAVEKAMEAAETAESAAEDMADQIQLAKDWATKTDGPVDGNEYSSKYYAEQIGADVHTVADIAEDVTAVAGNATNINAVASDATNINAVAGNLSNVDAVVSNETNVNTVATNINDINDCADNMAAIQDASNQAQNAQNSADSAAASAQQAQEAALSITGYDLFDHKWSDHLLNDQNWLRADTFSWQDGTVYADAYNHLVDDIDGKTATSETIGSYTISYYLADDGHKITTDETTVANIYNESGVAWYYILDTANQRFKLPRTKYGFVGLRDTVGNYVPESVPNLKGDVDAQIVVTGASGVFSVKQRAARQTSDYNTTTAGFTMDASQYSSAYQDDAPVQQRATQMYLYFYVGQFTQTATEQTAGLNSELFNGKVDLNAANLSTAGKSLISCLGMPSTRYDNLTLGASGAEYTAPANGYVALNKVCTAADQYCYCMINENGLNTFSSTPWAGYTHLFLPVKRGQTFRVDYTAGGAINYFRFIYAEGEENV